jgi:hypothetical protein
MSTDGMKEALKPPRSRSARDAELDDFTKALRTGDEAAGALRDALARHGLTLPSLAGDVPVAGEPMVRLGGAHVSPVKQLAQILNDAADALEPTAT